jgi:BirA family biotin operon repressor/biotin-[acetyl-CoA-carboxylase] ligase
MVTTQTGSSGRPALDAAWLAAELHTGDTAGMPAAGARLWREIRVVAETRSTNADLLAEARAGAAEGLVLAAEAQSAGRGRLGRAWLSPPGAALTFSVLLRPRGVPAARLGWLPLLAGVAITAALAAAAGLDARLKWPNDVLAGRSKLAGVLAEAGGGAVVVGAGLNVYQRRAELPVPTATSLWLAAPAAAGPAAREHLLAAVLGDFAARYRAWQDWAGDADGCGLRPEYLRRSATVGQQVTVTLPGGGSVSGTATDVGPDGRLVVRTGTGLVRLSAGDVEHVR